MLIRLLMAVFFLLSLQGGADAGPRQAWQQLPAVIDIRTTFSDGAYSVDGIVQLAKEKGIQALVINDHDRTRLEYGLPPFRSLLKKSVESPSINRSGADGYLQAIREAGKRNPEMVIIPGSESAPYYYWSGSPFEGTLTAHDHEKRILTIGLEKPESYRALPVVHNHSFAGGLDLLNGGFVFFLAALIPGILLVFWRGWYRLIGLTAVAVSVLGLFNTGGPFRPIPFNPYQGNLGMKPYQHFIDRVSAEGALTFWNYPETRSGVRKLGPIFVKTPPYPEALVESRNYTGFAALYGENVTLIEPGNLWDFALAEFCNGLRARPPWGIATSDFHKESPDARFGDFQTVLLVREKTKPDALAALKSGKMYAVQGRIPNILKLDDFSVTGADPDRMAVSGEEAVIRGKFRVVISVSGGDPKNRRVQVRLIRKGNVVKTFEGDLPARIEFEDEGVRPGETVYYRADVRGAGRLVTNPIFIKG